MLSHVTEAYRERRPSQPSSSRLFLAVVACLPLLYVLFNTAGFAARAAPGQGLTQESGEGRTLMPGVKIERELAGGQAHEYQIELQTSLYFRVVVTQRAIDVVLVLQRPDGKQLYQNGRTDGYRRRGGAALGNKRGGAVSPERAFA